MYNGTDLDGNQSPRPEWATAVIMAPFHSPPIIYALLWPWVQVKVPKSAGNCAACHTPAAAINYSYSTDPNWLSSIEAEGVPCDFCHKVWDVKLDAGSQISHIRICLEYFPLNSGVHMKVINFLPVRFDDVAPGEDAFIQNSKRRVHSAQPCHFGFFWDP